MKRIERPVWIRRSNGEKTLLSPGLDIASTFIRRLKGLIGRESFSGDEALLITNTSMVHMMFMRFPIDVIFCDRSHKIVGLARSLRPWRISRPFFGASYVVELPSERIGELAISVGDSLVFDESQQ